MYCIFHENNKQICCQALTNSWMKLVRFLFVDQIHSLKDSSSCSQDLKKSKHQSSKKKEREIIMNLEFSLSPLTLSLSVFWFQGPYWHSVSPRLFGSAQGGLCLNWSKSIHDDTWNFPMWTYPEVHQLPEQVQQTEFNPDEFDLLWSEKLHFSVAEQQIWVSLIKSMNGAPIWGVTGVRAVPQEWRYVIIIIGFVSESMVRCCAYPYLQHSVFSMGKPDGNHCHNLQWSHQ